MRPTCRATRDALLTADPDELRMMHEGQVAYHLRECVECRRIANNILSTNKAMDAALNTLGPRRSPDDVAHAVLTGSDAGSVGDFHSHAPAPDQTVAGRGSRRPRAGRLRRAWPVLPLAAAAAALWLLAAPVEAPRPGPIGRVASRAAPARTVQVHPQGNAAVFNTSDPDITLIWLY